MSGDPLQLALLCEHDADRSPDPKEAALLRRIADDYRHRAAVLASGGSAFIVSGYGAHLPK